MRGGAEAWGNRLNTAESQPPQEWWMSKIRVALIGVGNCASSLVQGVSYCAAGGEASVGLMHWNLGPYRPTDIEFVLAYDIDERKVGQDLSEAVFAAPNCTAVFCGDLAPTGVTVAMGALLDGVADHMDEMPPERSFLRAKAAEPSKAEVVQALKAARAQVLVNFLPVGSQKATEFYMECALEAGVGVVNCMPVFIASDPDWERRFLERGLPIVGDDVKAQLGATIVHRTLSNLFRQRGVRLDRTYQLNTGGNTDFLNMIDRGRLASKKVSKTEAVQSVMAQRLSNENIHVGPSDYVPWLNDNKLCFLRIEGALFGGVPMNIEVRLSVEDSPNSAGVVVDAIRCCKLALDRGEAGAVIGPSAYFCKHPPVQYTDDDAFRMVEAFIKGEHLKPAKARGRATADSAVKCLIVAAGQGTRLRQIAPLKPLASVAGTPLIERVIDTAVQGGASEFVVVTGYEGERLEDFLQTLAARRGLDITCVRNNKWTAGNGLSVVAAEPLLGERFFLLMSDHLFDPTILRDLADRASPEAQVTLAVDRRLSNPLVNLDDVTQVDVAADGSIRRIGKRIGRYNAFDTGLFLASKALCEAIRQDVVQGGSGGISGGMQILAAQGLASTFDIGDRFWLDVDDAIAFEHAEREQSRGLESVGQDDGSHDSAN